MALIGITAVVVSLAVVVNIGASSLREKDLEYQARELSLEKTLASEESRAAQLEEYRVYVQTKQYVEKVAKEKLCGGFPSVKRISRSFSTGESPDKANLQRREGKGMRWKSSQACLRERPQELPFP